MGDAFVADFRFLCACKSPPPPPSKDMVFVAGSSSSTPGDPACDEAAFIEKLDADRLHSHLGTVSSRSEQLKNSFAKLGETLDGHFVQTVGEAEKLLAEAKAQINRAAIITILNRPMVRNPQRGKDLRKSLDTILRSTRKFGLEVHIPAELMKRAQQVLDDVSVVHEDGSNGAVGGADQGKKPENKIATNTSDKKVAKREKKQKGEKQREETEDGEGRAED